MRKILFITQKRSDAIWIVDESVKKELKKFSHPFDFFEIHEKWKWTFNVIKNYVRNIFLLRKKCFSYETLYFTWENPYVIFIRAVYWKKKIVMTVHHVEDYWWKSMVWKLMIKSTDELIAISNFTKGQLMWIWVNENDILVNYNWISDVYYPEPIEWFTNYPYILYVWTEVPRKNTDLLLEVFLEVHKQHPELKLVKIWKPWTEEDKERFDNKVKELKLEDSVIIKRNFIEDEELRRWYSNALCYISLSKLEWFWLTIPEAMACWCPVIASDIWPFREICRNTNVLVNLEDKKNIIQLLLKILSNSGYRKEISDIWTKNDDRFNRKRNVKSLLKLFSF